MEKKQRILVLVFSLLFLGSCWQLDLAASSGKLSGSSVCTSGGVSYGSHGDGHWHRAAQHRSGWYADGSSLGYTNPCASVSRGGGSRSGRSGGGGSRNSAVRDNKPARKPERQAPKIEVGTASVEKFFFELNKELTVNDLISLFDVKALDSEDGDLSINLITTGKENIVVDNRDASHDIVFKVMNSAGKITEKKVTLHIKKRDKPVLGEHAVVTYKKTPTCEEVLQKQKLFIIDSDGAQRGLTCNDVQVDAANNRLIIRAADQYGLGDEFFVNYQVVPDTVSGSANGFWTFLVIVGSGVFFYNRWRKKKRKNDLVEE